MGLLEHLPATAETAKHPGEGASIFVFHTVFSMEPNEPPSSCWIDS
jgi:hypothetical protein